LKVSLERDGCHIEYERVLDLRPGTQPAPNVSGVDELDGLKSQSQNQPGGDLAAIEVVNFMNNVYTSVVSEPYLPRALALYASVVKFCPTARFAFFCMDDSTATALESIDLFRSCVYREAEFGPDTLRSLRNKRPFREYCWTAKPFALCHLLDNMSDIDWAIFVDADTLAFGDLDLAIEQAGAADFLVTPHRFTKKLLPFAPAVGCYNSGYLACRASTAGKMAAARWRDLCLQGCPVVPTDDAYSDQKYLERVMTEVVNGAECTHVGLNAAPWNIERYRVSEQSGRVHLDGAPLLLFHFQSLRVLSRNWLDLYPGELRLTKVVRSLIYLPYLHALSNAYAALRAFIPIEALGISPLPPGADTWLSLAKRVVLGQANLCHYVLFE
jgi:hypothetical protein